MKSTVIWSLVGLNLLLAAIVAARAFPVSSAQAQAGRPSDYLMIPGKATGVSYSVVYVIDVTTGKLVTMGYDDSRKQMVTSTSLDLSRYTGGAGGPVAPTGAGTPPNKGGYR